MADKGWTLESEERTPETHTPYEMGQGTVTSSGESFQPESDAVKLLSILEPSGKLNFLLSL